MTKRKISKKCPFCGKEFGPDFIHSRYCSTLCAFRSKFLHPKADLFGCWLWYGSKHNFGYGDFRFRGKYYRAHVFSYDLYKGDRRKGEHVLHTCDNPSCVNPSHLFKGSQKSNMADMAKKFRSGQSKLTPADVRQIRKHIEAGKTNKEIGAMFGVAGSNVSYINTGKTWSHVK